MAQQTRQQRQRKNLLVPAPPSISFDNEGGKIVGWVVVFILFMAGMGAFIASPSERKQTLLQFISPSPSPSPL
jgi:hypothetical protein